MGTVGRPPVLMKISGASSSRSLTRIVRGLSKRPWPSISVTLGALPEPVRHAAIRLRDDLVLARLDAGHVDADRTVDHDAEVVAAARDVRGAGARDQRLGRNAADIHTGAADALALEDRRLAAGGGEPHGQRRAGLAGADDDRVEAFGHASSPRARAVPRSCYADARLPRVTGSWITTPSIGSTGAVHGARSTMRFVSAYPACQRARMPAGVKSMSFV